MQLLIWASIELKGQKPTQQVCVCVCESMGCKAEYQENVNTSLLEFVFSRFCPLCLNTF